MGAVNATRPWVWPQTGLSIPETMVSHARFTWNQDIPVAPTSQWYLLCRSLLLSMQIGATASGVTLTHAIAMHLMQQRVTTSQENSSTAMPHVVTRTHTQRWRVQPTPWEIQNARHKKRRPVMPTLSRWVL